MAADVITCSRMLFSLLLLVFPPGSPAFAVLYLLCGVSDALDGFVARRLHTESERGARLDTAADMFFAAVYAVRILPLLSLPLWVWIWTAAIAAAKVVCILLASAKAQGLQIAHSIGNKVTGLGLFLLPLSARLADVKYGAGLVCAAATVTVITEIKTIKERL